MIKSVSLGLSLGILWGLSALFMTVAYKLFGYAPAFVEFLDQVYPGYSPSYEGSLVGFVWGFADAFFCGLFIGVLYNWISKKVGC